MKASPPPGTADIFPEEIEQWNFLEDTAKKIFSLYGFAEIRTPVFEYTEVFEKSIGDETEVVQKEMYTFEDRGGRRLTLRPEGTAGVIRALLGTDVMNGNERRLFYIGPMFRGERPAAGRRRQFHQVGVENVGRVSPELDAECIIMMEHYLRSLGINDAKILLNTRGSIEDRVPAANELCSYFSPSIDQMCDDCKTRIEKNIWRILDCKQAQCRAFIENAPDITNCFSEESREYFSTVQNCLRQAEVDFEIDSRLVRGLDYYEHTVFEITHSGLGAQNAIAGGGRYRIMPPNNKKPLLGVGFALGMERILMTLEALNLSPKISNAAPVFLVSLGDEAKKFNFALAKDLRKANIATVFDPLAGSMKSQMRSANRVNAGFSIICGDAELAENKLVVKEMATGEQNQVTTGEIVSFIESAINR